MSIHRPFLQVDVFTATPLRGNPLAVVLDGEGLSDAQMQAFAAWTQLSETTFVLPPTPEGRAGGADYRVRIFTPGGELPFAGHPTLGTAHAWLQAGGQPQTADRIVQECGVGLVTLREIDGRRAFAAPALRRADPDPEKLAAVLDALGLQTDEVLAAQDLHNGPHWLGLLLDDVETVLALEPERRLTLHFGMRAPGSGVLELDIDPEPDGRQRLTVTAYWHPQGVWGLLYWYALVPAHLFIFRGMTAEMMRRAEQLDA